MINYDKLYEISPFSLSKKEKSELFFERLSFLHSHHYSFCQGYRNMMDAINFNPIDSLSYYDFPFLPVNLFKYCELKSIPDQDVFKVLLSSGTTGQQVSKIFLDKCNVITQQKTLVKIVCDFIDSSRIPMIIMDCPSVIKNRAMFSARGAGILGFSIFATEKIFAFNDNMELQLSSLIDFLEKHLGKQILIFGFTYMIWQFFYKKMRELNKQIDFSNAVLIHGGGWKKLVNEAVSPLDFRIRLNDISQIKNVHDYYGMVEQTGCIYVQCSEGHFHASNFSDIIIRRPIDFSVANIGEKGIIQVVSLLPTSYPGFSLLTEDEGIILGEDDCPCGRKGKYFKVLGRIEKSEVRGCSDTYGI